MLLSTMKKELGNLKGSGSTSVSSFYILLVSPFVVIYLSFFFGWTIPVCNIKNQLAFAILFNYEILHAGLHAYVVIQIRKFLNCQIQCEV